jgi:hypothetical protein
MYCLHLHGNAKIRPATCTQEEIKITCSLWLGLLNLLTLKIEQNMGKLVPAYTFSHLDSHSPENLKPANFQKCSVV